MTPIREAKKDRLFSDENVALSENNYDEDTDGHNDNMEKLFEQESREEEDFEIPAFLRKQKF